jgi:hypothetical protein
MMEPLILAAVAESTTAIEQTTSCQTEDLILDTHVAHLRRDLSVRSVVETGQLTFLMPHEQGGQAFRDMLS